MVVPNVSIKNLEDFPPDKIKEILNDTIKIEEKFDGVKVFLIRNSSPYSSDYRDNWIVSYKDEIIYPDEYKDWDDESIKKYSTGYSQFLFVHKKLEYIHENFGKEIECNIAYFCEYLMRKPSIVTQYPLDKLHSLIGLGSFKFDSVQDYFGKVRFINQTEISLHTFYITNIINTPEDLTDHFNSIMEKRLHNLPEWTFSYKVFLNKGECLHYDIKKWIKDNNAEGIITTDSKGNKYKLVNDNQYNKEIRKQYRDSFKMSPDLEHHYWNTIYNSVQQSQSVYNFPETTKELNDFLSLIHPQNTLIHTKKNAQQIKDDIYSTFKTHILKQLNGNDNCLYLGKFRVFHNGHYGIIKDALKEFDKVIVGVVCKDKTEFEKRRNTIKRVFKDENVSVIQVVSGNIVTAMNKCGENINAVLCGEDRKEDYQEQVKSQLGMKLQVYTRTFESSTKILEKLEKGKNVSNSVPDMIQFKENT
jgi:cytidyltransferase-like protein